MIKSSLSHPRLGLSVLWITAVVLASCGEPTDPAPEEEPDAADEAPVPPKRPTPLRPNQDAATPAAIDAASPGDAAPLQPTDGGALDAPVGEPSDAAPFVNGRLATEARGSGLPGPPESCHGLKGENRLLPGTKARYCVGAHPSCKTPGAGCPLYITFNASGAYFKRLQDPARWGKFITVESRQDNEGPAVGDPFAELPRVIARDYPGLDESRIFAVGNSRGAAAIARSLCRRIYKYDQSAYGTTTDVYAGVAMLGICPNCDDGFLPRMGNIHFLLFDGWNDTAFAKDHCEANLRQMATAYRCQRSQVAWCNVATDDGIVKQGDGTDKLLKATFGRCERGAVVAYMARDEEHIVTATKNFNPPLSSYDIAWDFFQDKRKVGGDMSSGKECP